MFNKNDGTKAFKPVGRLRVFFCAAVLYCCPADCVKYSFIFY